MSDTMDKALSIQSDKLVATESARRHLVDMLAAKDTRIAELERALETANRSLIGCGKPRIAELEQALRGLVNAIHERSRNNLDPAFVSVPFEPEDAVRITAEARTVLEKRK